MGHGKISAATCKVVLGVGVCLGVLEGAGWGALCVEKGRKINAASLKVVPFPPRPPGLELDYLRISKGISIASVSRCAAPRRTAAATGSDLSWR